MATQKVKKRKAGRPFDHEVPAANKKMGRTSIIDWDEIDKDLMAGMSAVGIGKKRGYSEDAIYRACVRDHNVTFTEYRARMLASGEDFILDRQFSKAMQGDGRMLIHLGIHRCGQGREEVKTSPYQNQIDHEHENMILRTENQKLREQLNGSRQQTTSQIEEQTV